MRSSLLTPAFPEGFVATMMLAATLCAPLAHASVIGDDGRHSAVNNDTAHPSIGSLLDLESGALCTASLVAANVVLTEAHCALRPSIRSDCLWPHDAAGCADIALHLRDLRFLPGDDAQVPRAEKFGRSIAVQKLLSHGSRYDPSQAGVHYDLQRHEDWALLQLAQAVDITLHPPLKVLNPDYAALIGQHLSMPGYSADRYYRDGDPSVDADCRLLAFDILGDDAPDKIHAAGLIRDDCDSTAGASGSPILVRDARGDWAIIGMHSDGPDPRFGAPAAGDANFGTPSAAFYDAYRKIVGARQGD